MSAANNEVIDHLVENAELKIIVIWRLTTSIEETFVQIVLLLLLWSETMISIDVVGCNRLGLSMELMRPSQYMSHHEDILSCVMSCSCECYRTASLTTTATLHLILA